MDEKQLKNEIKNIIRESIEEKELRNRVRNIVREEIHKIFEKSNLLGRMYSIV